MSRLMPCISWLCNLLFPMPAQIPTAKAAASQSELVLPCPLRSEEWVGGRTTVSSSRFMKPAAKVGGCQSGGGCPSRRTTVSLRSSHPLCGRRRPSSSVQPSRSSHHHQLAQRGSDLHVAQQRPVDHKQE